MFRGKEGINISITGKQNIEDIRRLQRELGLGSEEAVGYLALDVLWWVAGELKKQRQIGLYEGTTGTFTELSEDLFESFKQIAETGNIIPFPGTET